MQTIQHPVGFTNKAVLQSFELELGNKYSGSDEIKALLNNIAETELEAITPSRRYVARAVLTRLFALVTLAMALT